MKKISFFALAACALAFNACNGDDAPDTPKTRIETISFEDCEFAANKSDNTGAYNFTGERLGVGLFVKITVFAFR